MEELSYVFTQYLVSCVHVRFYLSPPLIFTLLAASISHLPPLWISMFFSLRNSSPLFSITRSSSFSLIHVSVNTKITPKKIRLCCCFFILKYRAAMLKPWVAFGLPYLIELFYIGMPVVRTDDRLLARCTVTWLPNFLGWVDFHISSVMGLLPRAAKRRYYWIWEVVFLCFLILS